MDIVYSIDNNFIPQAAALTASICKNAEKSGAGQGSGPFVFHILSNGVTKENQKRFAAFAESIGAKAFFYDLGDFEGRLERLLGAKPETGRFVKAALGRIFIPEVLPADIRKYLYLDADMIARRDITPLFSLPLKGHILAAAAEPTIYADLVVPQVDETQDIKAADTRDSAFGLSEAGGQGRESGSPESEAPLAYYNTGALFVDRDAWEANDTTRKCLVWYARQNGKFRFADQDIINNVLAGRILPLNQKWNFQTNYHYQNYDSLVKRAPWFCRLQSREDYEKAGKDPSIVHYAGDERPWIAGNKNPYKKDYEAALSMTPWKDTPVVTGKEAYMQFYHLVNVLSEKIPGFRELVSRVYYQYRKAHG